MLKQQLLLLGEKIYSPDDLAFSSALFDEAGSLRLDDKSLVTAFLLKAATSNKTVRETIKSAYGDEMISRIELLQRIGMVSFPDSQKLVTNLRKLFIQLTSDLTIIFIKLSERLLTLKLAEKNNQDNLRRLSEECLYLYSPIAHRLGISRIYKSMEDIAFKHLYPADFQRLNKAVEKRRFYLESKLKTMSEDIQKVLKQHNIEATIQQRVKRPYSIFRKIQNKGITLDDIFDLLALRVVTNSVENCYLTLGVVHMNWIPMESRFRDWIAFPKSNGYRSIQTTVSTRTGDKYEIQIRTEQMHHEAEYGSAAHWAYKEGLSHADDWIVRLKEFLENDEYFENPFAFHELLKTEIKSDHIHILTPMGDIKTLPAGSTPIDFAYAIHTNLGSKITGARINGKFAKLSTELHSGDVVEAITLKNAKPSRDWLNFVKTSRARNKIRDWFQRNEKAQVIADGKKLWEKLLKQYRKVIENNTDNEAAFKTNMIKTGYKTYDDFFFALGSRSLKASLPLLKKLYPESFRKVADKKKADKAPVRKKRSYPLITVEGMNDIETRLAQCCHPIRGEEIVAYVTKAGGIKIHSTRCKYINSEIFTRENFKKAAWIKDDSLQPARIETYGYEAQKMLSALVEIASAENVAISSTVTRSVNDRLDSVVADVQVKDIEHLKLFLSKVKSSQYVDNATIL